jgi:dTDP-glucose 4,6-dehydratase
MRLVVTGGAGFIGSTVVCRAVRDGHTVLTIDKLTYAGRMEALSEVSSSPRHRFLKADIADRASVEAAFSEFDPDGVIHLAAESHVDRSIDDPKAFVTTNVEGTFVLLEAARRSWSKRHDAAGGRGLTFVHVSTDEVFGDLPGGGRFNLDSRYVPSSPYAASKAAGDHLARAWHRTYGLPVIVTNCSNNYGPRQHAEKLIPTVLRHALAGEPIPIYGDGQNVRDWLYVEDHVTGLIAALQQGRPGDTYLFGGHGDMRNLDLAQTICRLLDARAPRRDSGRYEQQIEFVADRPGHDLRYSIDPSHAQDVLGWKPRERLESGLAKTIDWYLANPAWLVPGTPLGRPGSRTADIVGAQS